MRIKVLVFVTCLLMVAYCSGAIAKDQTRWQSINNLFSEGAPAISQYTDESNSFGSLYVAATNSDGLVTIVNGDCPGCWSEPIVAANMQKKSGGNLKASTYSSPVFKFFESTLYIFVVGDDGNLYSSELLPADNWSKWRQITTTGDITGRISLDISNNPSNSSIYLHFIYTASQNRVVYSRFRDFLTHEETKFWNGATEGIIGVGEANSIVAVIREKNRKIIATEAKGPLFNHWSTVLQLRVCKTIIWPITSKRGESNNSIHHETRHA